MRLGRITTEQYGKPALLAGGGLLIGAAIWALFEWVVEDPELFLRYVKAIIWPLLVLTGAYWLRAPIRAKVGQIFRVEGWGAAVAFQQSPGEQLGHRIKEDVDRLGLSVPDAAADYGPGNDAEPAMEVTPARQSTPNTEEGARPDSPQPKRSPMDPVEVLIEFADRIATVLGLDDSTRESIRSNVRVEPQLASQQLAREIESRETIRRLSTVEQPEDVEGRRENVESIIRNSAEWGYDLGRSGAPKTVPDIHWKSDGTWQITTEVPRRKSMDLFRESEETRAIRELVKEIKEMEKSRHSGLGLTSFTETAWLIELKRRLSMIDPGNPWARD